jgi:lupus La protein
MSDPKTEAVGAANTPTKDEVVKDEEGAVPAVEKVEDVKVESKDTEANGTSNTKEEDSKDEKIDRKDRERKYSNGVLKTSAKIDEENYKNNSKYDPSILPETDDAQAIRNQVCSYKIS